MCFREDINPNTFGDLGAYCGGSRLAGGFGGVLPHEVGWKLVHCLRCWCDSAKKNPALSALFLTPAPSLFVGETDHLCLCPFAGTNVFSAEHMCFAVWARVDKKKLNLFHHVLYMDDLPGAGPTFEDHPQVFGQKKSSPLDFIFDTCASAFSNHFFLGVGEAEHMCLYPFATQMCIQLCKLWTSRSFEFSGLNGIVRVRCYFSPLNLHFAFRNRSFWRFEPSFRLSRAPVCHIKHVFRN